MVGNYLVNQTMLLSDTARPITGKVFFQRFRLASPVKRIPLYLNNKFTELLINVLVFFFPLAEFSKRISMKANHNSAARSLAHCIACSAVSKVRIFFPSFTSLIALSKFSRLAGERKRYSVSSQSGSSFSKLGCSRTNISMLWSGYASLTEFTNSTPRSLELSRYIASIPKTIADVGLEYKMNKVADVFGLDNDGVPSTAGRVMKYAEWSAPHPR